MIAQVKARIEDAVSRAVQSVIIGAGAAFCLAIGLAFLTLAAWLYLVSVTTTMMAALILGSVYTGMGMILIAILSSGSGKSRKRPRAAQRAEHHDHDTAKLVAAFMTGMTAGRKSRS